MRRCCLLARAALGSALCVLLSGSCNLYNPDLFHQSEGSVLDGGAASSAGGTSQIGGGSNGGSGGVLSGGGSGGSAGGAASGGTAAGGTAAGGTAAGGTASGGSSTGGAPGGGNSSGAPGFELIDDLEDNDAFVVSASGRDGHWDVANDGSEGGVQEPMPGFTMATALGENAPSADNAYAAYTKGNGFTVWGAFMNVSMRTWPIYEETPTYDASAYQGIALLAKVGDGSTPLLRVRFVSASTDPRGEQCEVSGAQGTLCFDHFAHNLTLTTEWQRYELYFADFKQAGIGKQFPDIDLENLYGFEFAFGAGQTFEVWIDELQFILAE